MNKRHLLSGALMICLSILLSISAVQQNLLLVIKYTCMACGITMLSYSFLRTHVHHTNRFAATLGYLIILCYLFLTIDTFLFHAITWFPGLIRYPIYSLYGASYIVFMLPGWLICFDQR